MMAKSTESRVNGTGFASYWFHTGSPKSLYISILYHIGTSGTSGTSKDKHIHRKYEGGKSA
jgi:hypothetical protein